ncbi:MAG: GNAT family N-acetyltransferase [Planctomycetota bacterium]
MRNEPGPAVKASDALRVEPMRREDREQVLAIYAQGIAGGDATFETAAPDWAAWDAAHRADCRLVARSDGGLLGWAALATVSRREVYAGVAEASVYVRDGARGTAVGRQLLAALVDASERAGVWTLQAGIFPENEPSLRLHAACGFRVVGRRERIGRRDGVWRDVLLLERRSPRV